MCDFLTAVITRCDILQAIPASVRYSNRQSHWCDISPGQ